jgi:hypothetical protein
MCFHYETLDHSLFLLKCIKTKHNILMVRNRLYNFFGSKGVSKSSDGDPCLFNIHGCFSLASVPVISCLYCLS